MMLSRKYLPLLGSLLISNVAAQNASCNAMAPPLPPQPVYNFTQPFLPFLAPIGTQAFDDADTSAIQYNGNWLGVFDPGSVNNTLHVTNDSSASIVFSFRGTGFEWFGVTSPNNGLATVSLAGRSFNRTSVLSEHVNTASAARLVQQRIFFSLGFPLDNYTLTITNGGSGLNVDAFVVTLNTFSFGPGRVPEAQGWSLIERGMSGVSAMQLTIVSPTHALIFDKVEHNYASIDGRPAWSVLYDLNTDEITPFSLQSNSFCAAGSFLSNGTLLSVGGNPSAIFDADPNEYHDQNGLQSLRIFEPCLSGNAADCTLLDMVNATQVKRWYPTVLRVTDGSAFIIGGGHENVFMNNHSINEPSVSFFPSSPSSSAKFPFDFLNRTLNANLFVHAFSLPNERAFIISNTQSIFYNWGASPPFAEENTVSDLPNGIRVTYPMPGAAMLLPLSSADNYTSRIVVCGGSDAPDTLCNWQYSAHHEASSQCSRIEIRRDGTTSGWTLDDSMPDGARVMPDGVLLPTGEFVIVNGARSGYSGFSSVFDPVGASNADDPALSPILYSGDKPKGQRFTTLGVRSDIPRLYHSVATLTPNGDVMITGSNPNADRINQKYPAEYRVEWLRPPYMSVPRPTYTGLPPIVGYGTLFRLQVNVPPSLNVTNIKVSLMDLGFATHSMHPNTRLVYLDFLQSESGDTLTVTAPPDPGVYPPGPAYLFVIYDGVASKGAHTLIGDGQPPPLH